MRHRRKRKTFVSPECARHLSARGQGKGGAGRSPVLSLCNQTDRRVGTRATVQHGKAMSAIRSKKLRWKKNGTNENRVR